ncbi:PqqD family peptide modification chaperone [Spirosoma areae]
MLQAIFFIFQLIFLFSMMLIDPTTQIRLAPNQSSSALGKETILLNYDAGTYYELNEVGGFIWSLLQTNKTMTVQEIQARILDEFDVEPAVCQSELASFLANLLREKLIETSA